MRSAAISMVLASTLGLAALQLQAEEPVPPNNEPTEPFVTETETEPAAPVVGEVRWMSPAPGAILFRPAEVTLDWASTYPEGTRYSITLSRDGRLFDHVVADGVMETNAPWSLPEIDRIPFWLRVKAMDKLGQMLDEDVIPIRILPADVIVISKANQRLWAFEDGKLRKRYVISTGLRKSHDTRDGWFHVYMRSRNHHSRLYDVPMPFALFFNGGQAIHASTALRNLGSPASHGCIRLPRRQAQALFNASDVGRPVIVTPWGMDMSFLDAFKVSTEGGTDKAGRSSRSARR